MADTTDQFEFILFELLSRPTTKTKAPPRQFGSDVSRRDGQVGRQALDNDHERLTVTLAGGQEAQHAQRILPL
jgi:hypothetical protein